MLNVLQCLTCTGPYKTNHAEGSLYYSSTNITMVLPASPACEIDVGVDVEVIPVAVVVEARKDGLAFGESVLHVIPVMI